MDIIEASCAADGLRLNRECHPNLVVLDLNLPDASGLDVLRRLLQETPGLRVLVFSMYEDPAFVSRALDAGAIGYVAKNDDPEALLDAIDKAMAGEIRLGRTVAQKLAMIHLRARDDPMHGLSMRERQVLELLGDGQNLSEIAARLEISYRTVANISSQLKNKLGVSTTAALVKLAVEQQRPSLLR